jgi:hypothetical protein
MGMRTYEKVTIRIILITTRYYFKWTVGMNTSRGWRTEVPCKIAVYTLAADE